ncbi:Ferrichrome outer membrane transporter/phage receptor [Commensalibacter sp. Nvir]|uniref:TonB-dependent siderophore receptor n=1 Tax=Commensalibacter sp. Nvir TaxID=3069817 RepID=UPI002D735A78|nr:Ferrichrome outer membrane transporter/phage receptor [Commensalibacter sp. Nvir]
MQKSSHIYLVFGSFLLLTLCKSAYAQTNDKEAKNNQSKSENIVVKGKKKSIVSKESSAATKSMTPLLKTPESVAVVTRGQMDMQNSINVSQAVRYSAGIASLQRGQNTRGDLMFIRGFGTVSGVDEYVDGLKMMNGQYNAIQQLDSYLLERIDVLKGPSSVLYGNSSPGGVVLLTTKLANGSRQRDISLEGGNWNYARGTVDIGDTLNKSGTLSWRFVGTGFRQDGIDGYTKSLRYAFQPSLNWQIDDNTALTLYSTYQSDPESNALQFFPVYGTVLPNSYKFSRHIFMGDRNFQKLERTQTAFGYRFNHDFNSNWHVVSLLRYLNLGTTFDEVYGQNTAVKNASAGLIPGTDYISRRAIGSKEHLDSITAEERVEGKFHLGPIEHNVMVGFSWQNLRNSYTYGAGDAPNFYLYHPNNNQRIPIPKIIRNEGITTNQEGIFFQDQMAYHKLGAQFGFRNDWSSISTRNHLGTGTATQNDQALTFRGAIFYSLPYNIVPYVNYSQSFQPATRVDQNGNPFQPTTGEQYETGIKYQPTSFDGFFTAALFNLRENNVLVEDSKNPAWYVAAGQIHSKGLELEAHTSPIPGLNLIASYTLERVTYSKGDSAQVGKRVLQIPDQFFSLYSEYTIQSGRFADLGGGIGLQYMGNTLADTSLALKTAPYTLIDAQMHYKLEHLSSNLKGMDAQITAHNLFNKHYVASCNGLSYGCFMGEGTMIIGRIDYHW